MDVRHLFSSTTTHKSAAFSGKVGFLPLSMVAEPTISSPMRLRPPPSFVYVKPSTAPKITCSINVITGAITPILGPKNLAPACHRHFRDDHHDPRGNQDMSQARIQACQNQ